MTTRDITQKSHVNALKSRIWTRYNALRRESVATGLVDAGRLNRALGLALRKDHGNCEMYNTTANGCNCKDAYYQHGLCKHELAIRLMEGSCTD